MKVITFSRTFPSYHPRKGQLTFFPEKIIIGLGLSDEYISEQKFEWMNDFSLGLDEPKFHTIRAGNRWKEGEWFSPRVWSGQPYKSKQIEFAPPIQIKKIWDIKINSGNDYCSILISDKFIGRETSIQLAKNDGLAEHDMYAWFNKSMVGQIICWNEKIIY